MENEKKTPDWIAIEGEYRAGVESVRTIAEKYGLSEGAIRKRAAKWGWSRDPAKTQRAIVSTGVAGGTHLGTQIALRTIQESAAKIVEDMQRGLRINRMLLVNLESAAESATDPREIKIIGEATKNAITSIREICELNEPVSAARKDEELTEDELDAELKKRGLSHLSLEESGNTC
jgi:hypothetical protein